MKMVDFLFARQRDDPLFAKPLPSVQVLEGGGENGSITSSTALESKQLQVLENGEKRGFFSRPWTPRRIAFFSVVGFLGLAIIVLVIALPIVLTRHHDYPGMWKPTGSNHDDLSYTIQENAPIWAVHDFPDPGLIQHNGTWYAFATNPKKGDPDTIHVPVATSTNFVNWTLHEGYDAMPTVGQWQKKINTWAPDLIQRVSLRKLSSLTARKLSHLLSRMTENSSSTTQERRRTSPHTTALEQQSRMEQTQWDHISPSMNP